MTSISNPLGDVRAEADHAMLMQAFFETPDYRTLLSATEKVIVVGRRGTGKSALMYKLQQQWSLVKTNIVVAVAPDEHHTLSVRSELPKLGNSFLPVRASVRLLWKYALMLAAAQAISTRYKLKDKVQASKLLMRHLHAWGKADQPIYEKIRALIRRSIPDKLPSEEVIGHLADVLEISALERELATVLPDGERIHVVIDRVDEGFDPDMLNIAFVDGMISAAVDVSTTFRGKIRPIVFLRDNIFRAVAYYDQDYSRNIEAFTLRLHWDVQTLFYLVTSRLKAAFHTAETNTRRIWNRHAEHNLHNEEGFKHCLTLTLYRPRDILLLLNGALEASAKRHLDQGIPIISVADLEASARTISVNRLDDLRKEYRPIFPSVDVITQSFAHQNPELSISESAALIDTVLSSPPSSPEVQQELAIYQTPEEIVRQLYSVGFLGFHDATSGSFIFCHDGKKPDVDFDLNRKVLVHPCYWIALGLSRSNLDPEEATQINDEYEIEVKSVTPAIRLARLGKLMAKLGTLHSGDEHAAEFERWCLDACRILFAGRLENIELHPNGASTNRRDIVGTNLANSPFWKRVRDDYGTRQVVFEIKNYEELGQADYRQVLSYLSGQYGSIAFFICRSSAVDLERERELAWFRAIFNEHRKMIIKVTAPFVAGLLSKQRNPQRHDAPDAAFSKLLDTYERLYLGQPSGRRKKPPRG